MKDKYRHLIYWFLALLILSRFYIVWEFVALFSIFTAIFLFFAPILALGIWLQTVWNRSIR
jgi:hypothetical protein